MNNVNPDPFTSIIILNYDGGNDLFECIESVEQTKDCKYEIILIDNGSRDDSHIKCKNEFSKIKLIQNKKNIGIWHQKNNQIKKVAAIGVRVSKWIAYHGFAININNNLNQYKKIIPCGILDKGVTNLEEIKNQDYSNLENILVENFIFNLKI